MAKIIWQKRASKALDTHLVYAYSEFGKSTEPLLSGRKRVYRYCHLMNRRFKLIYCYYLSSDIVHIADIWDTRVNPETLKRRIK